MQNKWLFVCALSAVLISAGIFSGGYFTGNGFYKSRINDRYVTVKGVSERDVMANLAIWNIRLVGTGDDLTSVQNKIEGDKKQLFDFFKTNGIADEEIEEGQYNVTDLMAERYRTERAEQSRFIVNYSVTLRTSDVAKIKAMAAKTGDLLKQGLTLMENAGPSYVFTKLNDIKPEMIAEATKSARKSAEQFATDSGSTVGPIRRANQGVFSIQAKNSTGSAEAYDGGYPASGDAQQVEKKVRVVSTIDYYLVQ